MENVCKKSRKIKKSLYELEINFIEKRRKCTISEGKGGGRGSDKIEFGLLLKVAQNRRRISDYCPRGVANCSSSTGN